jgi:hypothetical protein
MRSIVIWGEKRGGLNQKTTLLMIAQDLLTVLLLTEGGGVLNSNTSISQRIGWVMFAFGAAHMVGLGWLYS